MSVECITQQPINKWMFGGGLFRTRGDALVSCSQVIKDEGRAISICCACGGASRSHARLHCFLSASLHLPHHVSLHRRAIVCRRRHPPHRRVGPINNGSHDAVGRLGPSAHLHLFTRGACLAGADTVLGSHPQAKAEHHATQPTSRPVCASHLDTYITSSRTMRQLCGASDLDWGGGMHKHKDGTKHSRGATWLGVRDLGALPEAV